MKYGIIKNMFLFWIIIFAISLYILIKSADYFTDLAEKLGLMLGMSLFLVGALIVTFGTTLPEFATSLLAVFKGNTEVVSGNILGTVIVNILIGFGLAPLIWKKTINIKFDLLQGALPVLVVAMVMVIFTMEDGILNFWEGVLFIAGFLIYLIYSHSIYNSTAFPKKKRPKFSIKIPLLMIVSLLVIFASSKFVIDSLVEIAKIINIGAGVLAASVLAIGTSLPEIMIAIVCVRKEKFDLTLGNIISAWIYDIFLIIGVCALFSPLVILPMILSLIIPFCVVTVILYWIFLADRRITPIEGGLMILLYILYLVKLFNWF
ncbi:MAG: inner membrane protein [Parcubacteria group bacterium Athens1014_10]|nr:MAG: inner membrane protein [Parcubacteria group bacterium Athens1014_10]TSD05161.1 MAG: inner membrane protein [Parcubacteria group bacterium Athens0714_12]